MKAIVAGVDNYRWIEDDEIQEAEKGAEIDVSEKEFERAQKMSDTLEHPALVKPGSKEHKAFQSDADDDDETDETDESPAFPGTHAELDKLASDSGVTWPEGTKTVADKHAALSAAGVAPPASE